MKVVLLKKQTFLKIFLIHYVQRPPLSFGNETVHFRYSGKDDKKIGDVLNCWDFCGYLINDKFCNLLATNNKIQAQYIKFQKDFILLNNTLVIDGLNSAKY